MATTFARYPADGSTAIFTVPCPYIEQAHIKVRVNGFLCTLGAHYDFLSASQIRFRPQFTPVVGVVVEVRRETPSAVPLVVFQDGAILNDDDLNTATLQTLFISQETRDYYEAALVEGFNRINGGVAVSAQEAIDAAVQGVLESELLAALQSRITDIDANAETGIANTSAIDSLQDQVDALANIDGEGIATVILNEQTARIEGDEALAQTIALIGAKNGGSTAFILNLDTVRVGESESLGTRLSGITTTANANAAAIASEITARSNADSALASSITSLSSTVSGNYSTLNAAISSEATTRATQDSALSTSISNVSAVASAKNRIFRQTSAPTASAVGDLWLDSDDNNKAYRWDGSSWVATDDTRIAANIAAITAEATARADGDSALATSISTLASTVSSGDSTNAAAISSEATTRASADSALSSSISTLSSTVGGHTASLSTHASTLDGLTAQYMVKTDVNGRVAGFGLYNTGATSEFIVLADKFAVVNPASPGDTPVVPFVVTGGVVHMQNVVIGNALIAELNVGKLVSGTLNADIEVGTGKVIFDNGSVMQVTGIGFGSTSQFIEWFGPSLADLDDCTEANAFSYRKTNGDAYFGGTLSAGTLSNAIQTSSLSATAEVTLGPFGSNGNEIQVVLSYNYDSARSFAEGGTASGSDDITAEVELYQKVGAGSEVLVATLDVEGLWEWEKEGGTRTEQQHMGNSLTYTDTAMSTSDRTYRAVITARSLNHTTGGTHTQRVRIQATEE